MAKFFSAGKKMRIKTILILAAFLCSFTGCTSYDFSRRVVQQGNLLPQSKIERLKIGMSKEDTAILMGTSLLSPLFNNDRWDYAYTWRKGSGPMEKRNLSLYFVHGRLARIEHHP
ncbi:outer membrane protein assembly factor BamE [Legionella nagasakiensis]|uniref:outer membrane protein assembly factor BamE n=1 Tax=Legionella nagasakiensis TaxID=535290 RepID=UPI0010550693|nr:outer membrane protein assembly factor BamE [Legionella nagasakiensis]